MEGLLAAGRHEMLGGLVGAVRQLSDRIGQDLCLLMSWAGAGADFSVKDNQGSEQGWWLPTSSRAWCAFVASASCGARLCSLRMFYRTRRRQEAGGERDGQRGRGQWRRLGTKL